MRTGKIVLIFAALAAVSLHALAQQAPQPRPQPTQQSPPRVTITPLKGPVRFSSHEEALSAKVSMVARNASVDEILGLVAQDYGLNIVHQFAIPATVNIIIDNVTLRDAIAAILHVVGYRTVEKENILAVVPVEEEFDTAIYRFKNLDYTTDYGKAKLNELMTKMVSENGRFQVIQNSLVVTDEQHRISRILGALKELDVTRPQVQIEAKIVEISKTDLENMGIRFSVIDVDPLLAAGHIFPRGTTAETEAQNELGTLEQPPFKTGGEMTSVPGPALRGAVGGQLIFGATVGTIRIEAIIDALIQHNKGRVLSAPRIAAAEGKTGKILVGSEVPYVVSQVQLTTGAIHQAVEFEPVGIQLALTPHINDDGRVRLHVMTEVSSISEFVNNAPLTEKTSVETTVTLDDNQTYVIAALIGRKWQKSRSRVPLLSKIPILGLLFRSKGRLDERSELVVLLTPQIIRGSEDWERPTTEGLSLNAPGVPAANPESDIEIKAAGYYEDQTGDAVGEPVPAEEPPGKPLPLESSPET